MLGAITVHKAQGLTLNKVVIDVGKEFSAGLTFVACSRVCHLSDIMFNLPFAYRVASLAKSMRPEEGGRNHVIPTISRHSKIKKCEYKLNGQFYGQSSNRSNRRARFSTKLNMSGS